MYIYTIRFMTVMFQVQNLKLLQHAFNALNVNWFEYKLQKLNLMEEDQGVNHYWLKLFDLHCWLKGSPKSN